MKVGWVAFLTMVGALVWIFAAIGALAVARAVGDDPEGESRRAASLLRQADADVAGVDVAGLPRYAGSTRAEYRFAVWDDLAVTEVEYRTPDDVDQVRDHYLAVFRERGWTVEARNYLRGEWSYEISNGDRRVEVEIERLRDVSEVEIEATEPVHRRGPSTAR